MATDTFVYVKNPDIDASKWIENRPDEKQKAIADGYIFQSIYEYSHIPDVSTPHPACMGDLFIFANAPDDSPLAILALQVLLRNISSVHPEVDLSMFHYYVEYDREMDRGQAFVRIPAELFGSEIPCIKQAIYHHQMLETFLSFVNAEYPLSLNDLGRIYSRTSQNLSITEVINPLQHLSIEPIMWLPPENCADMAFTENHYTVEIDSASFMERQIDDLWHDIQRGYKWPVQDKEPYGNPLEEVYLKSQYIPTDQVAIEKARHSLSLCEIYKKIIANPELLTEKQIEKALKIFVQLGKDGLNMAFDIFEGQHGFTKEKLYNHFLFQAYNRDRVRCADIQECFDCPCDCGVRSPWQLEVKKQNDNHILQNFRLLDDGLYYSDNGFSDDDTEPAKLCSRFEVVARVCDTDGTGWGKLVSLQDADGNRKLIRIPLKEFQRSTIFQILLDNGLEIISFKAYRKIIDYFIANNPVKIIRLTNKPGWHENIFVLPEQNIGFGKDNISFSGNGDKFQIAGNLSDWQENVGKYCAGNSMLMLLAAYALTGPLLRPLDMEGGGFHLYGPSSVGKTTQAVVAGSICGGNKHKGYLTQWRTTANALEKIASMHNDGFLILDEIGETTSEDVYQVSYMLVNGQGKERMKADSSLRDASTWRLNFLSTGELPLTEKIIETGKRKAMPGQEIRMVDLPVMASCEQGVFENLHGCNSGAEFSHLLKTNASRYYGATLRAFLKVLCGENQEDLDRNIAEIARMFHSFIRKYCPEGSSGQVQRVVERFALIASAGAFACKNDILPWSPAEAESVAAKWFNIWLDERGTIGSKEIYNAINNLREHWEANRNYLYIDPKQINLLGDRLAGFKEIDRKNNEEICYMLQNKFTELIKGCYKNDVLQELKKRGMLCYDRNGSIKEYIHDANGQTKRVYGLIFSRDETIDKNLMQPPEKSELDKEYEAILNDPNF